MKNIGIVLIIVILTSSCALTSNKSDFFAENLLQFLPFPSGEWEMYQKKHTDINVLETKWRSKTTNDLARTFVYYRRPNSDVYSVMKSDNNIGKTKCDKMFHSEVLSEEKQNGYPQLTWFSECKNNSGYYSKIIHKAISGNDAGYVFDRIFKSKPNLADWELWLNYANNIKVCDSRNTSHPCPDGFKKVE